KNPRNSTNALAVCNWCITKHGGLGAAQAKSECYTANRARLYRSHLAKCLNFREYNTNEEVQRILSLPVPEDKKKRKFLSAKFNDNRTNVTRTNGVPNIPANKKSTYRGGGRKLPDDIADIINDSEFWTT
ncbi:6951_t:CDS:2, partial [Funneliformis caledonium]